MWNGAVFIPLIEEIDTIDPRRLLRFQFRGDGLAHEERGFQVLGEQVAPVAAGHPGRRHPGLRRRPARHVDQPVQFAVGALRVLDRGGHAVLGRDVGGDRDDRQSALDQRDDVVVEVFFGPAHRDDRRAGLGDHPRHGGADTAARGAGHHDHAPLETEQVIDH